MMNYPLKIIAYILIVLYGSLSFFALKNVNRIIRKYRRYKELKIEPQWEGFVRKDFNKWNQNALRIGCFLKFPFKFMVICVYVVLLGILILLFAKVNNLKERIKRIYVKIIGTLTINSLMSISGPQNEQKINTPIVISNHVNWFDIVFLTAKFYPLSIVSKEQISKVPLVSLIAREIQCLFVSRQSQEARKNTLEKIKQRTVDYEEKQNVYPLLIFPEGTTSNGRGILRFKVGAFASLPKITIIGLIYDCNGFDMGMDEVTTLEHFILSLALSPKLVVKTQKMEPRSYEDATQYMKRCQQKMSELTQFKIYNSGYTQKCSFKEVRLNSLKGDIHSN